MKTLPFALTLLLASNFFAARLNSEAYYHKITAGKYNAESEVTMPDGRCCDLVTGTMLGYFPTAIDEAIMDSSATHQNQMFQLLSDPKKAKAFTLVVSDFLKVTG